MTPQRTGSRASNKSRPKVTDTTRSVMGVGAGTAGNGRSTPTDYRLEIDAESPPPLLAFIGQRPADRMWLRSDWPGVEEFAIYVRTDVTTAEQAALNESHDYYAGEYQDQWRAADPEKRDAMTSPLTFQRQLLAPFILNWNAVGYNPQTETVERIPPPPQGGPDVFDAIPKLWYDWAAFTVLGGYLATGKAGSLRRVSEPTGTGDGGTSSPDPASPDQSTDGNVPEPSPEPSTSP